MDVLAIILIVVGIWLAIKVVGFFFKFAIIALVLLAIYWLVAPYVGAPPLPF